MILPALLLPIAPREGGNSMVIFGAQLAAMFAIFYFLLIRPQSVEAK
jgi:preprotein translocase subunit YajC